MESKNKRRSLRRFLVPPTVVALMIFGTWYLQHVRFRLPLEDVLRDLRSAEPDRRFAALRRISEWEERRRWAELDPLGPLSHKERSAVVQTVIPILNLNGTTQEILREAIYVLSLFSCSAESAFPKLIELLENEDARIRVSVGYALASILECATFAYDPLFGKEEELLDYLSHETTSRAIAFFIGQLEDGDELVRSNGAKTLGNFGVLGVTSDEAINVLLIVATDDSDRFVRADALEALAKCRQQLSRVIPLIEAVLEDKDPAIRVDGVIASGYLGKDAQPLIPKLRELANDEDAIVRRWSRSAIEDIAELLGH